MQGLTASEAQARLRAEGFNELPRTGRRTIGGLILEVLREPMFALLLGGGGDLSRARRPQRGLDAARLRHASRSSITVVQEARTERVLEALRDLTSPRALVIRDGERKRIAGREVVRGDLDRARRGRPRAGGCRCSSRRTICRSTNRC